MLAGVVAVSVLGAACGPAIARERTGSLARADVSGQELAPPDPPDDASPNDAASSSCPAGMIEVPSATFTMGSVAGEGDDDEHPQTQVTLSAYCIDRTEVTVAAYLACVQAGSCEPASTTVNGATYTPADVQFWSQSCNASRADRRTHPQNCVDWDDAEAFCDWVGGRLPTEAEWEYAARGTEGRRFPWGQAAPDATRSNGAGGEVVPGMRALGADTDIAVYSGDDGWLFTAPVGSHPPGASSLGIQDLAGNVAEWTSSWYAPYSGGAVRDPQGASRGNRQVTRGGSCLSPTASMLRGAYRGADAPSDRLVDLGFRCARASGSSCRSNEHPSDGHCCRAGEEWIPARSGCVCLAEDGCAASGAASVPRAPGRVPLCPSGMMGVPSGTFTMGSPAGEGWDNEFPQTRVTLNAYCIDQTEVTAQAYESCVRAGVCTPRTSAQGVQNAAAAPDHPANFVDWQQSAGYCRWAGGRLPTEAEWEYAARGPQSLVYPWGSDEPADAYLQWSGTCGSAECIGGTADVATHTSGRSWVGAQDMTGNVWEWVSDWFGPYAGNPVTDPLGPSDGRSRVNRGGGWRGTTTRSVRAARRQGNAPGTRDVSLGFRCARAPTPPSGLGWFCSSSVFGTECVRAEFRSRAECDAPPAPGAYQLRGRQAACTQVDVAICLDEAHRRCMSTMAECQAYGRELGEQHDCIEVR